MSTALRAPASPPASAGDAGELHGCPFCGAAPALEPHPRLDEAVRIACAAPACGVRPATEYLLREYAGELRAAWNARPPFHAARG